MMGGMMCSYKYRFRMDMRAMDALANVKLGSGCNLLGYYMYRGGTTPLGKRTPFLNEGQVPKRSYDYQAPIGEFGQIRESYGRLKAIHLFCHLFSGFLEETRAVLPAHLKGLQPGNLEPLRFSVRVRGGSGFLFVNNFQDHVKMRDRHGEEVRLTLPDREISFRFDLAAGENAILPFGLDLGGSLLDWATAQPMARAGNTWFFLAPEGMRPVYSMDGRITEAIPGSAFETGDVTIVTLERKKANAFWLYNGRAYLCGAPLLWDGETLKAETEGEDAQILEWSFEKKTFVPFEAVKAPDRPAALAWQKTGSGRYTVAVPAERLKGHKQVLLRLRYRGDVGHAFLGNEMISDNFCNGGVWDIRLDPYAQALKVAPLVLYLTPVRQNVTVDASAMAGLRETAQITAAELMSAELIPVDDYPLRREEGQGPSGMAESLLAARDQKTAPER